MRNVEWAARSRARRGSALLLAIFFLVVLFFLARAFQVLIPQEMSSALRLVTDTQAGLVADAAVQDSMAFMEAQLGAGQEMGTVTDPITRRTGTLADWSWTCAIEPDPQSPPRGTNTLRVYRLTAEAWWQGTPMRRVTAVLGQQSFSRFAWYQDKRNPNTWIHTNFHYDGPVHFNDPLGMMIAPGFFSSSGPPVFESTATSASVGGGSADGVLYTGSGGVPYDGRGNPIPGRYERMLKGGRAALRTGASRVEMPKNATDLARAAWGGGSPGGGAGVYVNTSGTRAAGGVYVSGNVDRMELSVQNGNSVTSIVQGNRQTTITEARTNPVTAPNGTIVPVGGSLVVSGGTTQVLTSLPNGVIYASGSIRSLKGVNKGGHTVAVEVGTGQEIVLGGDLTRADTTPGTKPAGDADNLGLVASTLRIPSSTRRNRNSPVYVYAAVLAGRPNGQGGLQVDGYANWGIGVIDLYGSLLISTRSPVGTADWSGNQITGFILSTHFDPNLSSSPPPWFPTIGKLGLRSWREYPVAH